jgi:hypothetical protein
MMALCPGMCVYAAQRWHCAAANFAELFFVLLRSELIKQIQQLNYYFKNF